MADYEPNKDMTGATLRQNVQAVLGEIAARAEACEDARIVPIENMNALRDAGFLGGFKPAQYGGLEAPPGEMFQAASDIATVCASTAWVAQLMAVHSHAIAYYDPRLQEEIWGVERDALIGSSVAPVGKVVPVEGGYRLSGRYGWSSGCDHASWLLLGGYVAGQEPGQRLHALFVVPRGDYTIVDTWYAAALKGTGSKDIIVDDIFVPDYRVETMMALGTGTARGFGTHKGDLFTLPFQSIFASGFSAVAYGIARAALDHYRVRLEGRVRAYTGAQVAASPPAFMHLAHSHHEISAARAILENEWRAFGEQAKSRQQADPDTVIRWRTVLPYVTKLCVSAVDRLMAASGGGAILQSSPLQRCFRDVHGAAAHAVCDYDIALQILGRHLIGAEPDPNLL
jgi:4-hydroxyphenylacetate 3-monooxygenase